MADANTSAGFRLAHTMMRVRDLEASLEVLPCETLGMEVLRRTDYPDGRFTNTFIGYGPEAEFPSLELTHNWDHGSADYDKGDGWGHICIETDPMSMQSLRGILPPSWCEDHATGGTDEAAEPGSSRSAKIRTATRSN